MPWRTRSVKDARQQLIDRVRVDHWSVSRAAREAGVSRTTAYKWLERYEKEGESGLEDQSRAPQTVANRTEESIEDAVIRLRRRYPTWGPKKLRAWLCRNNSEVSWPAASTMGEILNRAGLVEHRRRRRRVPRSEQKLEQATRPNEVWCVDFKGQFRLGNGEQCYPLTVTDQYSRKLLCCEGLPSTDGEDVVDEMEELFLREGLPERIRSDNGSPFASRGLLGLSYVSAWWLSLGIKHERIRPGHPEENGRHERMHLTLKRETARPAAQTPREQQQRFNKFVRYFNEIRPHEALGQLTPSSQHTSNERRLSSVVPWTYPEFDMVRRVMANGAMKLGRQTIHVSQALAGYDVALLEMEEGVWLVHYAGYNLGLLEPGETRLSRLDDSDAVGQQEPEAAATA